MADSVVFAAVAFLLLAIAGAAPASNRTPLRIVGDQSYPPLSYLDEGMPRGFDVEVARALAEVIGRDVQVELMPWDVAQDEVRRGRRDGLTELSITDARKKLWDFATPTLTHSFGLFINSSNVAIHGVDDLQGKRVAVAVGGLPREFLGAKPGVGLTLVNNYWNGFALLKKGEVDAVAADTWVAGYIINKSGIDGVAAAGPPFATLESGIAVPKGQDALLREINAGLATLQAQGRLDDIRGSWEPKQVVYLRKEQLRTFSLWAAAAAGTILFAAMLAWILTMRREIRLRKRTENELRTSERKYRELFDSALDGIVILSPNGVLLDANPTCCKQTGYDWGELVGHSFWEFFPPGEIQNRSLASDFREPLPGFMTTERRIRLKDGALMPVEISRWRLPDGNAQATLHDITERLHAEQEVRELTAELEQRVRQRTAELEDANNELQTFSYSVSHDLIGPARRIAGFSTLLLREYSDAMVPTAKQYLKRIAHGAQHMGELINDILTLSRASQKEIETAAVDLSSMASAIRADLVESAPGRKAEFVIEQGMTVQGDAGLLHIVLDNLLVNAWKYTSKRDFAKIEFGRTRTESGATVFHVRDNGVGFDMAHASRLFQSFERLHSQSQFGGTGIGLATVRRVVHRHHGKIWVEAKPDEGATFFFTFAIAASGDGT